MLIVRFVPPNFPTFNYLDDAWLRVPSVLVVYAVCCLSLLPCPVAESARLSFNWLPPLIPVDLHMHHGSSLGLEYEVVLFHAPPSLLRPPLFLKWWGLSDILSSDQCLFTYGLLLVCFLPCLSYLSIMTVCLFFLVCLYFLATYVLMVLCLVLCSLACPFSFLPLPSILLISLGLSLLYPLPFPS